MDLEKVTAKIRPRKQWEAIDLGVALAQRNLISLYKIWFIVTFPVFLVAALILHQYGMWVVVGFWWLLPLWERPLLHFLSRDLFGERLSVKQCVSAFFSLAKIQWFASLTWRRLSFTRSLDLPVIQLEGLKGSVRSNRLKVIHSIGSGAAVWLTFLFFFTEFVLFIATIVLAYLLLPAPMTEGLDFFEWINFEIESPVTVFSMNLLFYLSVSFVAPFYIACGFSSYLNQRTQLEAWDIELSFKRLAKRLQGLNEHASVRLSNLLVGSLLTILVFSSSAFSPSAYAEQNEPKTENITSQNGSENSHQRAKQLIRKIKAGDEFHHREVESITVKRDKDTKVDDSFTSRRGESGWMSLVSMFVSFIVEFALWLVLAIVIIFLVVKYRHLVVGLKLPQQTKKQKPKTLFGLDVQSDSLPKDPWQVALNSIERNEFRYALSLLYRASLVWFIEHTSINIREGDTEVECLQKILKLGPKNSHQFMRDLTHTWRALAYAHITPSKENLVELCKQWPVIMADKTKVGEANAKV